MEGNTQVSLDRSIVSGWIPQCVKGFYWGLCQEKKGLCFFGGIHEKRNEKMKTTF